VKDKAKTILWAIISVALLILAGYGIVLLNQNLNVQDFAEQLGIWGPIFIVLGIATGGIIVPLTSLPFLLAGLALYGFWVTFILYYLGNTVIAPAVDFWLARRYGKIAIRRLSGKSAVKKVEDIAQYTGVKSLIIFRLFGGILFDTISYAAGFMDIGFKKYYIITLTFPIPGMLIALYFIEKGITSNLLFLAILAVWGYSAGLLMFYYLKKKSHNSQSATK
jgi:uncharacterized membrane protein YdjX (TVP38/TMEM64 family)